MARSPLFDLYDPRGLLEEQARAGLLQRDDFDEDPFARQKATISDLLPAEQKSSMLNSLAQVGSSGLAAAGWLLDTPGSFVRGLLAGKPLSFLGTSDERVTGRDLLRQYGMVGDEDTWGNFTGSLAAEILLDPMTYMNPLAILGRGAMTQTGKAMKGAGLLRHAAEAAWEGSTAGAGRPAMRGLRRHMRDMTPEQALAEIADPTARSEALARYQQQAQRYGVDPSDLTGRAATLMDVRIPGTNIGFNTDVFGTQFGDRVADTLDTLGEASKRNPYTAPVVNRLYAGFHAPSGGTLNPDLQWDARIARRDYERGEEARQLLLGRLQREASNIDAEEVAATLRAAGATGVPTNIPETLRRFTGKDTQRALVDYAESPVFQGPTLSGAPLRTSGNDIADWVLENVPEFRSIRDEYVNRVQASRAEAVRAGLPDRNWQGASGTSFFPRQLKWWDNFEDPDRLTSQLPSWGGTPAPNASPRVEKPWARGTTVMETSDNFGRGRQPYTDIPGGQRTFRILTGGRALDFDAGTQRGLLGGADFDAADLQRRLIAADELPARAILEDAFDQIGVAQPFMEPINALRATPEFINATTAEQLAMLRPLEEAVTKKQDKLINLLRGSDQQFARTNTGIFDSAGWNIFQRYDQGQRRALANAQRLAPRLDEAAQPIGPDGLADGMVRLTDAAKGLGFDEDNFSTMFQREFGRDASTLAVPQRLADEMGTVVRSSQLGDVERGVMNAYDQFLSAWKVGALAAPAFHTRNLYSGAINAATFGAFNPLDMWAAWRASQGNTDALARRLANAPGFANLTPEQRVARFMDLTASNRIGGGAFTDFDTGLPEQTIRGGWLGAGDGPSVGRAFWNTNRTGTPGTRTTGQQWMDFLNDFFTVRGVGMWQRPAARNKNPFLVLNDAVGSSVEDSLRGGAFLNQLRKGVDPGQAADLVRLSQVDYSPQAFTSFERGLKKAIPFYSFQKGIVPSIMDNLLYRPGQLQGQAIRAVNRLSEPSEDNFVPEHMRQSAAIPLPAAWGGDNPELQRYLTNLDLPWESFFQMFTPGVGATTTAKVADTIRKTGSNLLGMTTPLLKAPIEYFTGKQLYSGRDLNDLYSVLERDLGEIGRPLEQLAVNFAPGGSRALGLYRQITDDRLSTGEKAAKAAFNLLAGAKVTDIDQDRARRQAARDMLNQMLETTPGVRTYENITVPEDVLRGMPQEQRDLYLLYKIVQSEAAKRAREKKKAAMDPLEALGLIRQN